MYVVSSGDAAALPPICPRCDTDFRRSAAGSPLRQHRTGFQRSSQVLASALAREMPEQLSDRRSRKRVIFSDSRQDAAKLAAGMELDHFRDMVRVCLVGAHQSFTRGYVAVLRTLVANSAPLASQVAPSTPNSVPIFRSLTSSCCAQQFVQYFTPPIRRTRDLMQVA
jgi:hypothetical protein